MITDVTLITPVQDDGAPEQSYDSQHTSDPLAVQLCPYIQVAPYTLTSRLCNGFANHCLPPWISQAKLEQQSVHVPAAIQAAAIPAILSGRNIALQSYMGSGKVRDVVDTALFASHTVSRWIKHSPRKIEIFDPFHSVPVLDMCYFSGAAIEIDREVSSFQ